MTECIRYDTIFIMSLKDLFKECPFIEKIQIKKQQPKINNKWGKVETNIFIEPLIKSENAWKLIKSVDENEIILKNVKGILNKLSKDNFTNLSKKLYDIDIDNHQLVRDVIEFIFTKAINEPCFGEVYAELCKCLSTKNYCDNTLNFKREILAQCQKEFEKEKIETDDILLISNLKRKSLGNISFVGELFNQNMISDSVIFHCIDNLITKINEISKKGENIECLCKLVTKTGYKMDKLHKQRIDYYFKILETISNDKINDFRSRFMIKDVLDLRKRKWVDRIKKEKAKTKKEVKIDYEKNKRNKR